MGSAQHPSNRASKVLQEPPRSDRSTGEAAVGNIQRTRAPHTWPLSVDNVLPRPVGPARELLDGPVHDCRKPDHEQFHQDFPTALELMCFRNRQWPADGSGP